MDHLKGKVFVEYLSRLKQKRIVRQAEEAAAAERVPDAHSSSPARPLLPPCALQALLDAGYDVALVLTQPDRPAGRGPASRARRGKATGAAQRI